MWFKKLIQREQVLMSCTCVDDDLTLKELHGKWYGGYFKCLKCGSITEAKVVNKREK